MLVSISLRVGLSHSGCANICSMDSIEKNTNTIFRKHLFDKKKIITSSSMPVDSKLKLLYMRHPIYVYMAIEVYQVYPNLSTAFLLRETVFLLFDTYFYPCSQISHHFRSYHVLWDRHLRRLIRVFSSSFLCPFN